MHGLASLTPASSWAPGAESSWTSGTFAIVRLPYAASTSRPLRFTETDDTRSVSVLPLKTDDGDGIGVKMSIALADNRPVAMGQTVKCAQPGFTLTLWAVPWSPFPSSTGRSGRRSSHLHVLATDGAGSAGRSNGSRTLLLPIPHTGLALLILVVRQQPLSGVTVGVKLASLSSPVASSNSLSLVVHHRTIVRLGNGGKTHFGRQWEPIVAAEGVGPGGGGTGWSSNEAVPLVDKYSVFELSVLKQHAIWLAESGVDCICVDWSNTIGSAITRFEQIPAMS